MSLPKPETVPAGARLAGTGRSISRASLRQQLRARAARRGRDAAGRPRRARRLLLANRAGSGERAAAGGLVAGGRPLARAVGGGLRVRHVLAGLRGQRPACRAWSRTPPATAGTSSAPGPASSGDGRAISLGRGRERGRPALGAAAQGRRRDALLPLGRRAGGAAFVDPRVSLQRGDGPPRRSDDARAQPGLDRRPDRARHVLRRSPAGRAGRDRLSGRPVVPALRQLRALRGARRGGRPEAGWPTTPSGITSPSSARPRPRPTPPG